MRGARRLGALFLCVTSVVAALEGDESAALKTRVNAVDGNVIVDVAEGKFSDEEKFRCSKKCSATVSSPRSIATAIRSLDYCQPASRLGVAAGVWGWP